ncbi:hypothetical protein HUT11_35185 (plasmid) [Streptomyces seoulensis]|nr:hypothetical protein HUT11_35185 [Streptomyces seoulensis]
MALFQAPILTNGATHPAQQFRMLVRDLARGSEGITQGDDMKVTQRSTPGAGVSVSDGSAVIKGRANAWQGHYAACNIGTADVPIASTGGTARSDMVILRVKDPDYEGSLNPATAQIDYFDVISNVSSSATVIPDGSTGIPLARIDLPANTSVVTNAMITDIRKIANPRRDRTLYTQSPASLSNLITGVSSLYTAFTTAPGWNIAIPDWATSAKIKIDIAGFRMSGGYIFGGLRGKVGPLLTMQPVTIDDDQGTSTRRMTAVVADTLTIPSLFRGTTQLLRAEFAGGTYNTGSASVDSSTTFIADVEFEEAPR